jgi:hypothetical protein
MKHLSVKAYAELVGKSDKTIYKQINRGTINAVKVKKGFQVSVDANMLKRICKLETALEEAKIALKRLEEKKKDAKSTETAASTAAPKKKSAAQRLKPAVRKPLPKPVKKSVRKPVAKKTLKKSPPKKRK